MLFDNLRARLIALALTATCSACMTDAERRAADDERAAKEEIDRICHLTPAERDAELEIIRKEYGVTLHCGDGHK